LILYQTLSKMPQLEYDPIQLFSMFSLFFICAFILAIILWFCSWHLFSKCYLYFLILFHCWKMNSSQISFYYCQKWPSPIFRNEAFAPSYCPIPKSELINVLNFNWPIFDWDCDYFIFMDMACKLQFNLIAKTNRFQKSLH
jgi:hypothetical protein